MKQNLISAPWSESSEAVLNLLKTSEKGLSTQEAKKRLALNGLNELQEQRIVPGWKIFLRQFKSPLVLILLFASSVSYFFGETQQVVIILIMVGISSCLTFIQEYRSERAARLLSKKLMRYAQVMRDGKLQMVDAREVVCGDIISLELGTVVPADIRLINIEDLEVDESILTGESVPVNKSTSQIANDKLTPQEQVNMVFMGTHVVQGSGMGVVTATGRKTEMGKTATLMTVKTEETDFQKGVRSFSNFLLKVTVGLILAVAIIMGLLRGNWIESILFALALAVGLSPELFPMIVTINLSRGMMHMSKKQVLVKRMIAIEDLGNADVFCTDKTGTLTVGKIRVRNSIDPEGEQDDTPLVYAAHSLALDANGQASNIIDQAIFEEAKHKSVPTQLKNVKRFDIVSFDFNRRRMSCVVGKRRGDRCMVVKGAVKEVLMASTYCTAKTKYEKKLITPAHRKKILALSDQYQDQGYRLIAVAKRAIEVKDKYSPEDEKELELIGFVVMSDAPKHTAKPALEALKKLNVRIIILTGDSERITRHVAEQLNFKILGLLNGNQIEKMSDKQLDITVEKVNIFSSITPAQKLRIVKALKRCGHTVGFMGDGVNDAPSLRAADVGVSFDSAVDVAKEAASVILMKKNLAVLAEGIREGRRTFVNTQTYINTTISSNFGNMLSLAGAAIFLPFVPMLPAQILFLNLLGDLPMLGISSDRVSDEDLAQPHKWNIKRISTFMWFFGSISSLADYATFGLMYFIFQADASLFRSGWFVESLITEVAVILLLRTKRTSLSNLPSKILISMCLISITLAVIIVHSPLGIDMEFVPLGFRIMAYILLIVLGYGLFVEMGKRVFYKYIEKTA